MADKYKIEEVKKESRGFFNEQHRSTSRDSKRQVAVNDWQPSESKAVQQSRERLSEPQKKK